MWVFVLLGCTGMMSDRTGHDCKVISIHQNHSTAQETGRTFCKYNKWEHCYYTYVVPFKVRD